MTVAYLDSEKIIPLTKTEAVVVTLFLMVSAFICEKRIMDCYKKAEEYRKLKEDAEGE